MHALTWTGLWSEQSSATLFQKIKMTGSLSMTKRQLKNSRTLTKTDSSLLFSRIKRGLKMEGPKSTTYFINLNRFKNTWTCLWFLWLQPWKNVLIESQKKVCGLFFVTKFWKLSNLKLIKILRFIAEMQRAESINLLMIFQMMICFSVLLLESNFILLKCYSWMKILILSRSLESF